MPSSVHKYMHASSGKLNSVFDFILKFYITKCEQVCVCVDSNWIRSSFESKTCAIIQAHT